MAVKEEYKTKELFFFNYNFLNFSLNNLGVGFCRDSGKSLCPD
jgi:hypothetical protein